ncbi:MAG TPA: UvrD-helicase domain-containing protein [Fimbriimonadaceae bacterium]
MFSPIDEIGLNAEQLEAVNHPGGPMLIFAGAGSGKTRVITSRIAKLIGNGVPPFRILAVTFTNKAAREMRERIESMVHERAKPIWMGTFHSVCSKMLRIDGKAIGIDPNFIIYDDSDQMSLMREIFKAKNIDDKSIQPRAILSEISTAKEKLLSPDAYAEKATGFIERLAGDCYRSYNALLKKANALDFDDLLLYTVRLLEQRADVREKYQDRFLHVLVDEYQDVNYAQYQIVNLISAKHRNVVVVGDDDQSIYAWRGADVSLILKFSKDHSDAKVIKLVQNYRSTKNILNVAYEVIRRNKSRADKQLWTENPEGTAISLFQAGTEQDEAMVVAERILAETRSGRRRYGDFAVLYRTNAQSRVLEEAFITMRIPHVLVGGQRFYERKEIKDMLSYMRLSMNDNDNVSLRRIINVPTRGVGNTTLQALEAWSEERGEPLITAVQDQGMQASLQKKAVTSIRGLIATLQEAREIAERGPVTPVLKHLLNASGYIDALKTENSQESLSRLENLQELLNVTAQFDATSDSPSLADFLESVSLVSDIDTLGEAGNQVTLMTLHSAKGLEFPIVFLVGLEEGIFPHSRSLGSDYEIEEERRLCYVGMTRAREELHLVHAHRRSLYGTPSFNRRSRFLDDIPENLLTISGAPAGSYAYPGSRQPQLQRNGTYVVANPAPPPPHMQEAAKKLRGPEWKPPFNVGDQVRHGKFGIGLVIACNPLKGDAEVTVVFPGVVGTKKLVQSLAKLEAV